MDTETLHTKTLNPLPNMGYTEGKDPKTIVIELFLGLLAQNADIAKAQLATLGGMGQEAAIWQSTGIPNHNGWLIEKSKSLGTNLIHNFAYHFCNDLRRFAEMIKQIANPPLIDAFHLDFCGGLNEPPETYKDLIGLVSNSNGKCLAITVADQRRNKFLDNFEEIESDLLRILGKQLYNRVYKILLEEQTNILQSRENLPEFFKSADPHNGVKRELGLIYYFLNLVSKNGNISVLPDVIDRYFYKSTYSGSPFRMRTYMFHLKNLKRPLTTKEAVKELLQNWLTEKLQVVTDVVTKVTRTTEVKFRKKTRKKIQRRRISIMPKTNTKTTQSNIQEQFPELFSMVTTYGNSKVVGQFNQMIEMIGQNAETEAILAQIKDLLGTSQSQTFPKTAKAKNGKVGKAENDLEIPKLANNDRNLDCSIFLLLTAAHSTEEVLKKAKLRVIKELKFKGDGKNKSVGSMIAWTNGKFRGRFIQRLHKTLDQKTFTKLMPDLAIAYGALTEPSSIVTVAELLKEAGISQEPAAAD